RLVGIRIDQRDLPPGLVPECRQASDRRRLAGTTLSGGRDENFTNRVLHGPTYQPVLRHPAERPVQPTTLPASARAHRSTSGRLSPPCMSPAKRGLHAEISGPFSCDLS